MKLCECGCGQPTKLAPRNRPDQGWVKGQPVRFLRGHAGNGRVLPRHTERSNRTGRAYNSWDNMKQRCLNSNHDGYHRYGARGVSICDRWLGRDGFANFLMDMGERT